MKLKYLSVLISTVIIANSTKATEIYNKDGNKLDLFGKFNTIRYISDNSVEDNNHSFIYYGFSGETILNQDIIGFGTLAQVVELSNVESTGTKSNVTYLGFAGIKFANAGSIDYGRNYGVLYDISAWTNIMPEFSNDTIITDDFMIGHTNGLFTYRNTNFFGRVEGLHFALQYHGKNNIKVKHNDTKGRSLYAANSDGYGLSITYDLENGISAGVAYASSNCTFVQSMINNTHNENKKAEACSLGLKYDANNLYLAVLYTQIHTIIPYNAYSNQTKYDFADKAYNFKLVAQYALGSSFSPSISYLQSRIYGNNQDNIQTNKKYLDIGTNYNFSKNMLTFIDYRINLLSKNNIISDVQTSDNNVLALGITYTF